MQLHQFCSTYSTQYSFPNQKSLWKVQVNVVTSQELKMVCGESNEINGEKKFYVGLLRKNLFAFE